MQHEIAAPSADSATPRDKEGAEEQQRPEAMDQREGKIAIVTQRLHLHLEGPVL